MNPMKVFAMIMVFLCVGYLPQINAQDVQITVDSIEANDRVSGYVSGLDPKEYSQYKVLLYVHTDQWYIHPFAGQGEGMSWAAIGTDGTWKIRTVQREFKANMVAALVVDRNYPEPNKLVDITIIPNRDFVIKELRRDSSDYGKL